MLEPSRLACACAALFSLHAGCGHAVAYAGQAPARLPQPAVPGYHEPDSRSAGQARPDFALALTGPYLLHARHPELGQAGLRPLAETHVFASAPLRF